MLKVPFTPWVLRLLFADGSPLPGGVSVWGIYEVWGDIGGMLSPEETVSYHGNAMNDERKDGITAFLPHLLLRPGALSFSFTLIISIFLLGENNFSHVLVFIWSNS